jgi:hypothetical protein
MKFKQLLSKISVLNENAPEHTFGGGLYIGDPQGKLGQSALTDKGTHNIKLPHSLDAINAMLYGLSSREYIDPDGLLGIIKQKLNHFGFDFAPKGSLQEGPNMFELVQYGSTQLGVYGQNPYDDVNKNGFKQGDGIKEKIGHSLALSITVVKQPNHLKKLSIVIVPTGDSSLNSGSDCGCMH